jgi:hypothetical protein
MKPVHDVAGFSVLSLTSRFVLERLPYLLLALAAVVVLPRVVDTMTAAAPEAASSIRMIEALVEPPVRGRTTLDRIRHDHAAFGPTGLSRETANTAEASPEDR